MKLSEIKALYEDDTTTMLKAKTVIELKAIIQNAEKASKALPDNPKYKQLADKARQELNKRK